MTAFEDIRKLVYTDSEVKYQLQNFKSYKSGKFMAARLIMLALLLDLLALTVRVNEDSLAELAVYATILAFL